MISSMSSISSISNAPHSSYTHLVLVRPSKHIDVWEFNMKIVKLTNAHVCDNTTICIFCYDAPRNDAPPTKAGVARHPKQLISKKNT